MTAARRKVTLNLMPMLDLMLIVIFAQFLAMRDQSQQDEARAAQAVSSAEEQRQLLEVERLAIAEQRREAEAVSEKAFDQRDLVGQLASELFDLPDDTIDRLMKQRFADDPPTEQELAEMRQEFRKLRGRRGHEVLKHLLTFHEIRKRCDVWEVYVDSDVISLKSNGEETSFRADSPQSFASQLFNSYRQSPQPKGMVLIVLSWGKPRLQVFNAAMKGFPQAIQQMQADSRDRTRFEYAILGYDPQRTLRPAE